MIGHSEFPAASYDAWKLASPYDDYDDYDPREDCDHSDYDVDFEGRAECTCGHRWWMTPEQLERHDRAMVELEREYDQMIREERRKNRPWRRAWRWLRSLFEPKPTDDIPF